MIMDNGIDLAALRAFRTVIRAGTFAAAAAQLRMPKSTLSKRVADLEADLGVRLIERSTRALRLTAEGEVLAARADQLLSDAEDIRRTLRESRAVPRGHLRLSVPTVMGHLLIGGLAARFRARHPEITLEVLFLDRPPDLLEERFDGALRFGPLDDGPQVARVVLHAQAVLAASPSLPGLAGLAHPAELAAFPLIALAPGRNGTWATLSGPVGARHDLALPPVLCLGSMLAVRDAVLAGAGIGLIPRLLTEAHFASGCLVRLLPDWATEPKPLYFVYPSAQSLTARLRSFIDFLVEDLRAVQGTLASASRTFT